jgi:hypothetical protein
MEENSDVRGLDVAVAEVLTRPEALAATNKLLQDVIAAATKLRAVKERLRAGGKT